ncbi:DUF4190 domain-containing protein [Kitasatospora camelliae]|uniref:DUF4190 domain-containing protein n=1 Tax=Kitasatospora camelliae TaxID=3156397 RepID=A0AAU8K7X2_9ACTN
MPSTVQDPPARTGADQGSWPRPMTRFAITSVATGLLGLWPLAVGFAVAALVKVRRGRHRGKGLAVLGLVLSVLGALVTTVQFLGLDRFDRGRTVPIAAMAPGDCFYFDNRPHPALAAWDPDLVPPDAVQVPCAEPHNGEVVAVAPLERVSYLPQEVADQARTTCAPGFADYLPDQWTLPANVVPSYIYPRPTSKLTKGERLSCVYADRDGLRAGSVRRSGPPTGEQQPYLAAVRPYNLVVGWGPDIDPADADVEGLKAFRAYAGELAAAEREAAGALRAGTFPEAVRADLARLAEAQLKAAELWQRVDAARGPDELAAAVAAAERADDGLATLALPVRRALGLATGRPGSHRL